MNIIEELDDPLDTQFSENKEEISEFLIDSDKKADWAIEKIKEERQRKELFISVAKAKIEDLKNLILEREAKFEHATNHLRILLNQYMDTVPVKKSKTQYTIDLPSGKLIRKLPKLEYVKKDDTLLQYLTESAPDYVKNTPTPMWGEFKKQLEIVDGIVMRKDTGEVVDCISVTESAEYCEVE